MILIDQATGNVLQRYTSPDFSDLILFDVALAKDNTFYVLGDFDDFTGVIVHMNLAGDTLGEFTLPVTDSPGFLSPEGFGYDPTDGSFWVPLTNSATLLHVDSNGNFLSENSIPANPDDAAVGPDGNIYISQVFGGQITQFNPSTGTSSFFASSPFPLGLTWSAAGDLWVGDLDAGVEKSTARSPGRVPDRHLWALLTVRLFRPASLARPATVWVDANVSSMRSTNTPRMERS